jgi:uncharacterized membrane protein
VIVEEVGRSPKSAGWSPRHAAAPVRNGLGAFVAVLALIAVLVLLQRLWAAQVLLVPLLLIVPGAILLRALRIPGKVISSFPVYVPCASIVVIFGSGLIVDLVGPLFGTVAPLRSMPLLVGLEITCLALLAASMNAPPNVTVDWNGLLQPARLAWPFILPLIAAAGALRLNNGDGNAIAITAIGLLVIVLITAAALSSRLDETLLRVILYTVGLALTWSDSLRGDPLYGFDIATEFQRLQETVLTGMWHTAHPSDPYGAMLSLTVMPAELHALAGVPSLLVFKVVYPAVYALFPVAIYDLARKILSRPWSFLAAAFTIGQYAFAELAGFARQEIALVLFAAFIAAILDIRIQRRGQWALIALLGLATALSHYSTTYVAITVTGLTLALQWVTSWFRDIPRITGAVAVAFTSVLAGAFIWYGPVTNSDSHVLEVVQTVQAQGLNVLPNRAPGSSLLSAYLQGNTRTPIQAEQYEKPISKFYSANHHFIKPFPDAGLPRYELHNAPIPEPPVKWRLGYDALTLCLLVIEQLANLVAALGAFLMIVRRDASVIMRQIGLLALATILLLTVLRFSGTLAVTYGQERAQLQGLAVLTITLCWVMERIAGVRKVRQARVLEIAVACLVIVFFNSTYLISVVFGGQTSVNLANSGPAFEYFYTTQPEIASAQWLGKNIQHGQLVYSDEYGQVPIAAAIGIQQGLFADLTPLTLNQNAWVYASRSNTVNGRAFALYRQHLATYAFPYDFLFSHYNLVYTNGSSEVFHR